MLVGQRSPPPPPTTVFWFVIFVWKHKVASSRCNLHWLGFTHVGPQCDPYSPTVAGIHPLSHNWYVCIHVFVPACRVCSLGTLTVCTGCLLLPICEEQGSDMACPFYSLRTFDMPERGGQPDLLSPGGPSAELQCSSAGGGATGAELRTPPLLSWCVKSLPFVRRHVPVCPRVFF